MIHHWILSTGRTGTVAIARDINARCTNGVAINEPHPRALTRMLGAMALDGRVSPRIQSLGWHGIAALRREPRAELLIESNALIQGLAGHLLSRSPQSQLLHIVREPTAYIRSAVNFGATPIKRLFSWYVPGWELSRTKGEVRRRLRTIGPVDMPSREALRYALHWRTMNSCLAELGNDLGPRYRRVRFEDMFDSTQQVYDQSLEWLGLELGPDQGNAVEVHNQSRRSLLRDFGSLPIEIRSQITEICEPLAQELGYDTL